jgi:hypothetical protein
MISTGISTNASNASEMALPTTFIAVHVNPSCGGEGEAGGHG